MIVKKGEGIGEKHRRMLDFIQAYEAEHKHPPSVQEIQTGCNISSSEVVTYYLDQLERGGFIMPGRRPE